MPTLKNKYIRTKDGRIVEISKHIYKPDTEELRAGYYFPFNEDLGYWECDVYEEKIVNQADTIEELCDFVYVEYKDNCFETYDLLGTDKYLTNLKQTLLEMWDNIVVVYYGIKTDKGLIYVAKMNDKGKLELL